MGARQATASLERCQEVWMLGFNGTFSFCGANKLVYGFNG
jgi:hypothetical protein